MLTLLVASSSLLVNPSVRGMHMAHAAVRMAAGDTALIIQNKGGGHGESKSSRTFACLFTPMQ